MTVWSVIGAGVAGLTVATELVSRGADVQIFDPAGAPPWIPMVAEINCQQFCTDSVYDVVKSENFCAVSCCFRMEFEFIRIFGIDPGFSLASTCS